MRGDERKREEVGASFKGDVVEGCGLRGGRGGQRKGAMREEREVFVALEALDGVRRSRGRVGFEYACGSRHGI